MMLKKTNDNSVVEYFKTFLNSQKRELVEYCYYAIKDKRNQRYFKESIVLMEDSVVAAKLPRFAVQDGMGNPALYI